MKQLLNLAILLSLSACAGEPPQNIGNLNGRLALCPDSPNCVCSFETRDRHQIAPLDANLAAIEKVLLTINAANIVKAESNYLYVEFTSRIFGFVDDVEFLYDPLTGVTHVRSASRIGRSDLGVNRRRIETIRSALSTQ